ncbi:MAG: hypothetical protein K1060chlam5_00367 [Candidatus Anoxychlamydiales bacterium]|nr:hypothetical protein [Candidatus Anoxychlamydiales bacterium]
MSVVSFANPHNPISSEFSDKKTHLPIEDLPKRPRAYSEPNIMQADKVESAVKFFFDSPKQVRHRRSSSDPMADKEVAEIIKRADNIEEQKKDVLDKFVKSLGLMIFLMKTIQDSDDFKDFTKEEKEELIEKIKVVLLFSPNDEEFLSNPKETKSQILDLFKNSSSALDALFSSLKKVLKPTSTLEKSEKIKFINEAIESLKIGKIRRHQALVLLNGLYRTSRNLSVQPPTNKTVLPKTSSFWV